MQYYSFVSLEVTHLHGYNLPRALETTGPIAVLFGSARAALQGSARRVRRVVRDWARVKPCAKKEKQDTPVVWTVFQTCFCKCSFRSNFEMLS